MVYESCLEMSLDIKRFYTVVEICPYIGHDYISVCEFHIGYCVVDHEDEIDIDETVLLVVLKPIE